MIKLAVLGLNHGYKFATDIKNIDGVELVAAAGNDTQAAERARLLHVPLFRDYKTLLNECHIEGAIITLPNHLHKEAVKYCAEKGIHVLIEKPIAVSVEDGIEMIEAAKKYNIKLLVGHHRRFSNKVNKLRELIMSGMLGELVGVNMLFTIAKGTDYFEEPWRISPKGGGPLLNNAIHDVDTIRYATGLTINNLYATSRNYIRQNKVEDAASILLETAEGPTINYFVSDGVPAPWSYELTTGENPKYAKTKSNCYLFFGTKGCLTFPGLQHYSYQDEDEYGWEHPLHIQAFNTEDNDPMTTELLHFIDMLHTDIPPLVTGEDAVETIKVILAIKQSIKKQQAVAVE